MADGDLVAGSAFDGRPILLRRSGIPRPSGKVKSPGTWFGCNGRAEVIGLFVSASPSTDAAITECKIMLSQRVIVLADLNEILMLLENPDANLGDWLRMGPAQSVCG